MRGESRFRVNISHSSRLPNINSDIEAAVRNYFLVIEQKVSLSKNMLTHF